MKHFLLLIAIFILPAVCIDAQEATNSDSIRTVRPYHPVSYGHDMIEDPLFPAPRHRAYDSWEVHEGINAQVSMSATVGLGKHSPKGVGFGRSIDFLYVSPIRNKWNYTLGATTTAFDWGHFRYNDVGFYGSANYYPSDKVILSVNGYKSLMPNAKASLPFYYGHMDSYIGGDLNLKLSRNSFLEFHVGTSTWKE